MMLGDELHTKTTKNICFLVESSQTTTFSPFQCTVTSFIKHCIMSDRSFSVKCIYSLFWETKLCIISNGCHLGYTGRVDGHNFGLEGNSAWTFFGQILVSYDSVVLKKNTFKDF